MKYEIEDCDEYFEYEYRNGMFYCDVIDSEGELIDHYSTKSLDDFVDWFREDQAVDLYDEEVEQLKLDMKGNKNVTTQQT
jgi:hypothetical protein